ncbi:MAG: porin [bacterium]
MLNIFKTISSVLCLLLLVSPTSTASAKLSGYLDTEFYAGKSSSTFKAHRFILHASSQVHEHLFFNSELEFEYGANTNNGGEIKIEQAWLDYSFSDAFIQRTGIILIPFGRVNILHDSDLRDATMRPIYAKYIVPTTWMDTGVGFRGTLEKGDWLFTYDAYLINGLNTFSSEQGKGPNESGIRKNRPGFKHDNNQNKAVAARLMASPFLGLELGTSLYHGNYDNDDKHSLSLYGFDVFYKQGPLELISELAQVDIEGQHVDQMFGYYVEGRYHLPASGLSFLTRDFAHPVFTLFARYSAVDTDTSVDNEYDRGQITLGINFRPVESVVYKLEYEWNTELKNETDNDQFVASLAVGF